MSDYGVPNGKTAPVSEPVNGPDISVSPPVGGIEIQHVRLVVAVLLILAPFVIHWMI